MTIIYLSQGERELKIFENESEKATKEYLARIYYAEKNMWEEKTRGITN